MSGGAAVQGPVRADSSGDRIDSLAVQPPGGARAWLIWGTAVAVYFLAMFHRNGLGVAALEAQQRFHVGPALLSLLPMLQLLVYVVLQVPTGLMADRIGPRRSLLMGLAAMTGGTVLFALAPNIQTAVAGRVLIGLGDAVTFLNVIRLGALWFPRSRYALISALTGVMGGLGQIASVAPLAAALHGLGWTAAFLGSAGVTAAMALLALLVIRDRPAGARDRHPHVPITLWASLTEALKARGPRAGMANHAAVMAPYTVIAVLWGYPFLVEGLGMTSATAGLVLTGLGAGTLWLSPVLGAIVGRRPSIRRPFAVVCTLLLSLSWVLLVCWPGGLPPVPVAIGVLAVSAAGTVFAPALSFDFARDGIPVARTGVASGLVNMSGFTAAVIGIVGAGVILQVGGGFQAAFLPVAATTVLATAALLVQLRHYPRG